MLDDPRVAGVTLTGSEAAGRHVAERAGRQLKKTVLELGGSDPLIVMPSADLPAAIETAVKARMINSGQSCIAAKRFIVAEAVADEFERRFSARVAALKVGDPLDETTEVGPLATASVLADLDDQVRRSVAAGARVLTGGHRLDRPGHYYAPTVLVDVPRDAPAAREEVFGPVAALFRVPDLDAAIRLANDTTFGLGCSVWTTDPSERARVIAEIEAGQVFVNAMVVSIRGCRSAASSTPASDASSAPTAFASSSTSRRSGSGGAEETEGTVLTQSNGATETNGEISAATSYQLPVTTSGPVVRSPQPVAHFRTKDRRPKTEDRRPQGSYELPATSDDVRPRSP